MNNLNDLIKLGYQYASEDDYLRACKCFALVTSKLEKDVAEEDFLPDLELLKKQLEAFKHLKEYYSSVALSQLRKEYKVGSLDRYDIYLSKYGYDVNETEDDIEAIEEDKGLVNLSYHRNNILFIEDQEKVSNLCTFLSKICEKELIIIDAKDLIKDSKNDKDEIMARIIDLKLTADFNMWCSVILINAQELLKDYDESNIDSLGLHVALTLGDNLFHLDNMNATTLYAVINSKNQIPSILLEKDHVFHAIYDKEEKQF